MKILIAIIASVMMVGCTQIDEGSRGIYKKWGKVEGDILEPDLHWYNPWSADIIEVDVREHIWDGKTNCYTKDNQQVDLEYAITAYPDKSKIKDIYIQFGSNWEDKIIPPKVVEGIMKDAIGEANQEELVSKRESMHEKALAKLKKDLEPRGVIVTTLSFANLKFKHEFEQAAENKVIAFQKAEEAKNKTKEVEQQAIQITKLAQANADAMKIKSQALSQNQNLVAYELALKWDGKLPQNMLPSGLGMFDLMKAGK